MSTKQLASERLLEAVVQIVRRMKPDEVMHERMGQALFSDDGAVRNDARPTRDEWIMMSALQLLNALSTARDFKTKCEAILRMKSVSNDDRADWCRSLAWHYGYVLRERARTFVNNLKTYLTPLGKEHTVQTFLCGQASDFTKKTGPHLLDRGKHTHNFEVDDPLVAQVRMFELLSTHGEMQQLKPLMKQRAAKMRQHVKHQVAAQIDVIVAEVEKLVADSERIWSIVFETIEKGSEAA